MFGDIFPSGMPELDEYTMERVLEEFEQRCYDNMNHAIETEEGLGIEYDEDVVCDVCQSPDGEDGNEMVFCDKCNICVHQVRGRKVAPWPACPSAAMVAGEPGVFLERVSILLAVFSEAKNCALWTHPFVPNRFSQCLKCFLLLYNGKNRILCGNFSSR